MKRPLDPGFDPPAPIVPVRVRESEGTRETPLLAKVDTGADLCACPADLIRLLALRPVRVVRASGFAGAPVQVPVVVLDFELDGIWYPRVEAVTSARPYALLGRNLLRHLLLRIDGPRETLALTRPTIGRRLRRA